MAYLKDEDLEFLQFCDNEDLQVLVDYLTKDKDGDIRISEELTESEEYKRYYPHNLPMMWEAIARELQHYGGNTFANAIRSTGVYYNEILRDVAKKNKVNFNSSSETSLIEYYLLQSIMEKAISEMSEEELKEFLNEMNSGQIIGTKAVMSVAAIHLVRTAITSGGFAAYKISVIVANAVARQVLGRGLAFATNAAITSGLRTTLAFLGPLAWAVGGVWALFDIASPAYRVTMPCVIQIAYMRMKYNEKSKEFFKEIRILLNDLKYDEALRLLNTKWRQYGDSSEFKMLVEKTSELRRKEEIEKAKVTFYEDIEILLKQGKYEEALSRLKREAFQCKEDDKFKLFMKEALHLKEKEEMEKQFSYYEELFNDRKFEELLRIMFKDEDKYGAYDKYKEIKKKLFDKMNH